MGTAAPGARCSVLLIIFASSANFLSAIAQHVPRPPTQRIIRLASNAGLFTQGLTVNYELRCDVGMTQKGHSLRANDIVADRA